MEDVARFVVRPPLRCAHQVEDSAFSVCGREARWQRAPAGERAALFFCDEHHLASDVPVTDGAKFLRVSLVVEVLFVATHLTRSMAQGEAVRVLERAVENSGGVLSIQTAHSTIGQWEPTRQRPRHAAAGDRA